MRKKGALSAFVFTCLDKGSVATLLPALDNILTSKETFVTFGTPYFINSRLFSFKEFVIYEPGHAKTCLMPYTNNKGADQPAHPRSLISAFVFASWIV